MLTIKDISKVDKSDMLGILLDFPNQIRIAKEIGSRFRCVKLRKKPHLILWSGMGGSAIGGDLIASYIEGQSQVPVLINRHYKIPACVNKNSLAVISSYSGNTEETISSYKEAKRRGASILAISSGGKLVDWAIRDKAMLIVIPRHLPPRCALGYLSIPVLVAFSKLGLIQLNNTEIREATSVLAKLRNKFKPDSAIKTNFPLRLARELRGKIPLIYGSADHFGPVAYRWRGQFAENAKMLSSHHLFAEMNHNEIEAFEPFSAVPRDVVVIMLKDKADHPRIKRRMEVISDIIRKKGVKVIEVNSIGQGLLARLLSCIYIGDWVSFYLAVMNKIDPTPVHRIAYLKRRLAK